MSQAQALAQVVQKVQTPSRRCQLVAQGSRLSAQVILNQVVLSPLQRARAVHLQALQAAGWTATQARLLPSMQAAPLQPKPPREAAAPERATPGHRAEAIPRAAATARRQRRPPVQVERPTQKRHTRRRRRGQVAVRMVNGARRRRASRIRKAVGVGRRSGANRARRRLEGRRDRRRSCRARSRRLAKVL